MATPYTPTVTKLYSKLSTLLIIKFQWPSLVARPRFIVVVLMLTNILTLKNNLSKP